MAGVIPANSSSSLFFVRSVMERYFLAFLILSVLSALTLLSACTNPSPSVSLTQAIAGIQNDLNSAGTIGTGKVSKWSIQQDEAFTTSIKTYQCKESTADPLVPLITDKLVITAQGTSSSTKGFELDVPTSPQSSVAKLTGSSTNGHTDGVSVPVSFVPLSAVPNAVLATNLTRLGVLVDNHTRADPTKTEGDVLLQERDLLDAKIDALITSYTPSGCAQFVQGKEVPLMGDHLNKK